MKKFLIICLLFSMVSCNKSDDKKGIDASHSGYNGNTVKSGDIARIKTVHGNVLFRFFPDKAPNTVKRIKELIKSKFYDGIIFHRVVPGFVAQGGDPTGTGTSGSGKNLKAEFNDLKHIPGALAMARAQSVDSADSQFYITMGTFPHLDNKYTIFGFVTKGMDVVKKISQGDKMISVTLE
jgi:peptidylprolyl isomerase